MLKEPGNGPPPSRATPECALPPPPHPPPPPHGKLGVGQEMGGFWQRSRRKAIAFTLSRQTAGLAASWALAVPAVSHLDHSFPPAARLSGATARSLKSPVVRSGRRLCRRACGPTKVLMACTVLCTWLHCAGLAEEGPHPQESAGQGLFPAWGPRLPRDQDSAGLPSSG